MIRLDMLICFALAAGLLAAFPAGGCQKPGVPSDHETLGGTVEGLRAETFELTIRPGERWVPQTKGPTITAVLTNDTEIYVNDKFSNFDAIAIGDTLELIGYFDTANPRGQRFVVSLAYITRNEPPPPEPDLTPPTTEPADQPQES